MGAQLGKIYSGLLYEVQLWVTIAELGVAVIRQLYLDPIKLLL